MDELLNFSNLVTMLVSAAVTWAGSFLFYRQRKESMVIENETKQSEEWKKLYLESQKDSLRKDEKIDELRKDMNSLHEKIIQLERMVQMNSIYRCDKMDCPMRFDKTQTKD